MSAILGCDLGSHLIANSVSELDLDLFLSEPWPKADADDHARFFLIRAYRGSWQDPNCHDLIDEANRLGVRWGLWLVLSPWEPLSVQLAAWSGLPSDLGDFPLTVDYERWSDGRIPTGTALLDSFRWCENRQGQAAMGYSRYRLIDTYLNGISTAELNRRYWWVAQYLYLQTIRGEFPVEDMTVPKRIQRDRIILLQTANRLPPAGGRASVPNAAAVDRDRWVGTMSFDDFFDDAPEPPPLTDRARIERLEKAAEDHGWSLE